MLPTHYDYRLVALSVFIAICAAYAALGLAERVTAASTRYKWWWIGGGACAMGTAVWSMHYIGMLAFKLPIVVHYDVFLVLVSLIAAILASVVALFFTSREKFAGRELLIGSLAMGTGIATMHYIGMAAMRMRCTCTWDARIVALSVVIAITVSGVALASLRSKSKLARTHKVAAAVLLGIAISSMHYTGMAAAHFWHSDKPVNFVATIGVSWLGGIGIAAGTLLLLSVAILSSMAGEHFAAQSIRLQSTEERYRFLFERSLAGIYRATVDGEVIDLNDACLELLGYTSRDQVLGKIIRHAHMAEEDRESYVDFVTRTKRLPARETQIYRTDGSSVWVMHTAALIEFPDGSPAEIQGMLLSIDQLKRTEEELLAAKHAAESANRAKSQFLANMSHELRTPLNGMLGIAQLMLETAVSPEQKEQLEILKASAEGFLMVVSQILEFSRTGVASLAQANEEFDLREVVEAEVARAGRLAQKKSLKLLTEIAPEVASKFWGEPHWIRQILSSLLDNAVKFTSQGEIAVNVASRGRSGPNQLLSISVRDTGIGIPAEKQAIIFEPFYQADASNTRRFGGTGLGLSIVRSLTQAMGGQISLESQPGQGSTFRILISLVVQAERVPVARQIAHLTETLGPKSGAGLQGESVLAHAGVERRGLG